MEQLLLYQLLRPDPGVALEESVGALAALQAQGKIRYIGLFNVITHQVEAARQHGATPGQVALSCLLILVEVDSFTLVGSSLMILVYPNLVCRVLKKRPAHSHHSFTEILEHFRSGTVLK